MANNNPNAVYAVACHFNISDEDLEEDDFLPSVFFVTFQTQDEDKAIKLAQCFCGSKEIAKTILLILDKDGQAW